MRKKLLTLAVATVAASSLLTGCGGSSSNDKKEHLMKISQQYPEKMDQEREELSLSYSELNRKIKMEIK